LILIQWTFKGEAVMELSPEERRKIYEEEKARIEAEQQQQAETGGSTTGLEPNVAGLLCYLGGWVTGIIFLVIEQENRFVRFHALQSLVTFAILTIAGAMLGWIPGIGGFSGAVIGILSFVLWLLLMVKAYQGELYKLPVAGEIAQGIMPVAWRHAEPKTDEADKAEEPSAEPAPSVTQKVEEVGKRVENYFSGTRAGRIAGYGAVIFWDVVLIVFFSFFHQYIAWYHVEPNGGVTMLSLLNGNYFIWLPLLITALVISIAANIILIIYDRYWFREIIQVILTVIGVVVVANLVSIFPFDFSVIPNVTLADIMPLAVTILLIMVAVGMGVGALVRFIKLITGAGRSKTH
jgi:uncharacterized membrane protein